MSSKNIGTIDPAEVFVLFGPKRITGFAKGQYFNATKDNPDHTYEEGADGEGAFVRIPSNAWTITLTLMATSRSNDYLWLCRETDLNLTPGGVLVPFAINHKGTKLVGAKARIMGPPSVSYSSDGAETRVWVFKATFFEGTLTGLTSE